jgi:hypothetical protein
MSINFERNQSRDCLFKKPDEVFVRRPGQFLAMLATVFHRSQII